MTRRTPDLIALMFGAGFVAFGILVIAGRVGVLSDTRWMWPAVLVAVGIFMLAGIAGGRRRHHAEAPTPEPQDTPAG
jgi:hypothetical protein